MVVHLTLTSLPLYDAQNRQRYTPRNAMTACFYSSTDAGVFPAFRRAVA